MYSENIDLNSVRMNIQKNIEKDFSLSCMKYRIFSRVKSITSIKKKLSQKKYKDGKKMQDLIGVRITLYHVEDVEIIHSFLKKKDGFVDESTSEKSTDSFKPVILNLVMKIPEDSIEETKLELKNKDLLEQIDLTYEIQIRTVFSEGWHEVEHDMRYKCQKDWRDIPVYERRLNGILASLENAEWAMQSLFEKLAYDCYKEHRWTQMLRNKMRISFHNDSLSDELLDYFNKHEDVVKSIFKTPRKEFISTILEKKINVQLTYDNVVFILNRIKTNNTELKAKEKEITRQDLDKAFNRE